MKNIILLLSIIGISFSVFSQSILDSGLVAYFPFTGNALDLSGNNNHGNVLGPVLTTDRNGNPNNAYLFDGVDDIIEIPSYTKMSPLESVTIAAWIKTNSAAGAPAIYDRLNYNDGFGLKLYGQGNVRLTINGGAQDVISSKIVTDNQWHHVVGTYDRNDGQLKIYVDCKFDGSSNYYSYITYSPEPRNNIGGVGGTIPTFFDGKIDELRVYDRALSQNEIGMFCLGGSIIPESDFSPELMSVFPNPVQAMLNIGFSERNQNSVFINILDVTGKAVYSKVHVQTENIQVDVSNIEPGIYFLRSKIGQKIMSKKIIIQ